MLLRRAEQHYSGDALAAQLDRRRLDRSLRQALDAHADAECGLLDRLHSLCEDIPKQEEQDPRRPGIQERAHLRRGIPQAPQGKTEEHGEPRDRTKREDLGHGHRRLQALPVRYSPLGGRF